MRPSNVALSVVSVVLLLAQGHWCGDPSVVPVCGKHNPDGIGNHDDLAIDDQAKFGEFPWLVAVFITRQLLNETIQAYHCGGSLIHPKVVLTAAHAYDDISPARLMSRVGEWKVGDNSEMFPHQDRNVSEVVLHPEYSTDAVRNSFALLFLESPVTLAEGIQTICLPPPEATFDLQRCLVSGWGTDIFGKKKANSSILEKAEVTVVSTNECQSMFRTAYAKTGMMRSEVILHGSFICASGDDGKMEAWGGRGSPLVCPIQGSDQQFQQAGIVVMSIRTTNTTQNIPGVFANVAIARSWIDREMGNKNLDISSYDSQREQIITTLTPES